MLASVPPVSPDASSYSTGSGSWTQPKGLRKMISREKGLARDVASLGITVSDIDIMD